jgi:tuftelin-interacting protein 11
VPAAAGQASSASRLADEGRSSTMGPPAAVPAPPPPPPEEPAVVTVRQQVEEWCVENDLQMLPEKRVLHPAGPLYRITAAGHGKNGTLVCFQRGERLLALQRRGAEMLEIPIVWADADARDALLEMAWHNVK